LLVLKRYDEALPVAKKLNVLRPESPIYYFSTGLLYERLHDTISSKKFFTEANTHFDRMLDTMNKKNTGYESLMVNKAINLILLYIFTYCACSCDYSSQQHSHFFLHYHTGSALSIRK